MPNHCKNVLKIRCSDEALMQKIKDTLIHERKWRDAEPSIEFTMRNYMPIPDEFKNAGGITIYGAEYKVTEEEIKQQELAIACDKWIHEHWGTKWDCYNTDILHQSPTELEVFYMTAWSPNLEFMTEYINNELLGKVEYIQYYYYEWSCDFSGYYRYENGIEIQEYFDYEEVKKKYPEKYNEEYFKTHGWVFEEVFEHLSPLTPEEEARAKARREENERQWKEHPENFEII